jgi:uncharacterized protein YegP (UPF0339 family)
MFPKRNCARKFTTGKGGTMVGKFELKTAKDGEFFFHLKAANGQIVLASEMYKGKSSAENGIESVKKTRQRTPTTSARTPRTVISCST